MTLSTSLNQFRIPMLGKFLGGAEQNTHGSFVEGEVYVITAYNPHNETVQTTGNTTRNRWIDASAFEVTRNTSWSFKHGHHDLMADIAKFEDRGHDDHVEALNYWLNADGSPGSKPFGMHIDLSNSPDYSASGRYIGANWPELQDTYSRAARRLSADEELSLKQVLRRQGKSMYNHLFATGHVDALRAGAKERRFSVFSTDQYPDLKLQFRPSEEGRAMLKAMSDKPSVSDDVAEAIWAATRMMGVAPSRIGSNCRCAMPELKKGLHSEFTGMIILDDPYAAMLEDGKPTFSAPFVRNAIEANEKMTKTITARIERGMNVARGDLLAMSPISEGYNCSVECVRDVGAFEKGQVYRAIHRQGCIDFRVEHPHTAVAVPVDGRYFIPSIAMDDRDAPLDPMGDFDFEGAAHKKVNSPDFPLESELADESTFVHKSATRKTQEVHVENESTSDLRKYRFNPEA